MRSPSTHRRRLAGAVAVLALAAGGLLTAAGPAGAASSVTGDCDPVGTIALTPTTVDVGGQVNVSWSADMIAACNPPITAVSMSGPGFNGDEVVPGSSGSRTVTVTQPGTALWKLSISTTHGETELTQSSATVIQPVVVPGLAGGALAFADNLAREQKAEAPSVVMGNGPAMMSGTTPALFNVGADYEVAYHGLDGFLWVVAPDGTATDTGLGMEPLTSPSMTATGSGTFTVAFSANTGTSNGDLWTYSSTAGGRDLRLPVFGHTSPGITLTRSGVAITFADSNDDLSVVDPVTGFGGFGSPHAPLAAGTSPAITYIPGQADGYEIVYQAPDGTVRSADSTHAATFSTALTAAAGTSPAITTLPSGEIDLASTGPDLIVRSSTLAGAVTSTGVATRAGTDPSIAPAAGGGTVIAFQNAGFLDTFTAGTGVTGTGQTILPSTSPAIAQITSLSR